MSFTPHKISNLAYQVSATWDDFGFFIADIRENSILMVPFGTAQLTQNPK